MNLEEIRKNTIENIQNKVDLINIHLPLLDSDIIIGDKEALVNRIEILHLLYTISIEGLDSKGFFYNIIKEKGLDKALSKNEFLFLDEGTSVNRNMINFSWYKESIYALLWCGGLVQEIYSLEEINMGNFYSLIPPEVSVEQFLDSIKLRTEKEMLVVLDYYYNLHWSFKHSEKGNSETLSIIRERRKSLEWFLYNYNSWDNVLLDT
ncbi:DUF4272 domain-containing protein [Tenacibaculum halocynthiae]|uniref:DUF4272 domain-containing protein n=1 Tax=Tenacibaculum halocynthiae TaxID=1254437 RepID=UPI003893CF58